MKKKQSKPVKTTTKKDSKKSGAALRGSESAPKKAKKSSGGGAAASSTSTASKSSSTPSPASNRLSFEETKQSVGLPTPEPSVEIPIAPSTITGFRCDGGCGRVLTVADAPIVLEWGRKADGVPGHIGRPWKRVMCRECDREKNGAPPPRRKPEAAPVSKSRVFPKREQPGKSSAATGKLIGKIYKTQKDNPRKEGTHGWNSWEKLKDGMTVDQYLQAGGRNNDLRWDLERGWVELR